VDPRESQATPNAINGFTHILQLLPTKMSQIQVKFVTAQTEYAVPNTAILLPTHFKRKALSEIINHLLGKSEGINYCNPNMQSVSIFYGMH
jgi:hypothetical protein